MVSVGFLTPPVIEVANLLEDEFAPDHLRPAVDNRQAFHVDRPDPAGEQDVVASQLAGDRLSPQTAATPSAKAPIGWIGAETPIIGMQPT